MLTPVILYLCLSGPRCVAIMLGTGSNVHSKINKDLSKYKFHITENGIEWENPNNYKIVLAKQNNI